MHTGRDAAGARAAAIDAARQIYWRPEPVVDALIDRFAALPDGEYPGVAGVTRASHGHPVAVAATPGGFGLHALHWPMLNLLDTAEQQRRRFADAVAAAVEAARAHAG